MKFYEYLILYVFCLLVTISVVSSALIEDDTEDSYNVTGSFYANNASAFDENWNSYAHCNLDGNCTYYINYTALSNLSNVDWKYSFTCYGALSNCSFYCYNYSSSSWLLVSNYTNGAGLETHTETLNSCCYQNTTLMLMAFVSSPSHYIRFYEERIEWLTSEVGEGGSPSQPPLDDGVLATVSGGGSFREVLESWNPSAYNSLEGCLLTLFDDRDLNSFFKHLWVCFVLFLKYIFKQPASLMPMGGLI